MSKPALQVHLHNQPSQGHRLNRLYHRADSRLWGDFHVLGSGQTLDEQSCTTVLPTLLQLPELASYAGRDHFPRFPFLVTSLSKLQPVFVS